MELEPETNIKINTNLVDVQHLVYIVWIEIPAVVRLPGIPYKVPK